MKRSSGSGTPCVSLVVPAYNEARRIERAVQELARFGTEHPNTEILIVVERSTDGTLERGRRAADGYPFMEVIDNAVHRGKGYAVRSGMLRARGDVVFFMDADLSTPLEEVPAFVTFLEEHPKVDIAIGSREHPASDVRVRQTWVRQNMGRVFNQVVRRMVGISITDTQCGFKAFRWDACQKLFAAQTIDGFAFDVEILLLAKKSGFSVEVLPVRWENSRESKVGLWTDPAKMLWDLFWISRKVQGQ